MAECLGQDVEQDLRVGGAGERVARAANLGDIGTFIADQLCVGWSEDAKLEAGGFTAEEDIVLVNEFGAGVAEASGDGFDSGRFFRTALISMFEGMVAW